MRVLRDWRVPAILAAPILIWLTVAYFAARPVGGAVSGLTLATPPVEVLASPTPYVFDLSKATYHYPAATSAPVPAPTVPCGHQVLDPLAIIDWGPGHTIIRYEPAVVCRP